MFQFDLTEPLGREIRHIVLDELKDADEALAGYLRLVQQGVGIGVVKQIAPGNASWSSFLERLLIEAAPAQLHTVAADKRLAVLVKIWNFGEGLLREPAWVDRYVNACSGGLARLDQLEAFLTDTLEPALAPLAPATWAGKMLLDAEQLRKKQRILQLAAVNAATN